MHVTNARLILYENQDIATLGVVNVRYCGYTAVVKVEEREDDKKVPPLPYIELLDQPDGGACALNINSLRLLLHKKTKKQSSVLPNLKRSEMWEMTPLQWELWSMIGYNIYKTIKWKIRTIDKKVSTEKGKNELKVEGLGTPLRSLKNKKKDLEGNNTESKVADAVNGEVENSVLDLSESQLEASASENESALKKLVSDAAFTRLKESETGLHRKVVIE
ncbi:hypothetical protein Tco_0687542 [Tanacetum coccineum]